MDIEPLERSGGSTVDTVLIVDDDAINRAILGNLFEELYRVEEAPNGRLALDKVLEDPSRYCAILLDFAMDEMDGLQMLEHLREARLVERIPVFLITAEADDAVTRAAYALGVMDVIGKPVVPYVVRRRVQSVVELFQARRRLGNVVEAQQSELLRQANKIIELNRGMVEALAAAIEFRDGESGGHVLRIHDITWTVLSETPLGDGLTAADVDAIAHAAILHDVGKIAIPDAILSKPGKLTPEEYEIMKTHTTVGAEMLAAIPQLCEGGSYGYAVDIARHHHERWDGRGYPDGLVGDEISIWAQVVSLADVYDALVSKRVYKPAFTHEEALRMIREGECGAFNPQLVECFSAVEPLLHERFAKHEGTVAGA